ncbi:DUF1403 family protein (plasmid) [Nitrobacter sp. NHB1]|uniref:DUF1403 family protein n=1 Tax=Nitrobacter sp. NHB1 TaxID=3119830 RepID=UPI002FFF1E2F
MIPPLDRLRRTRLANPGDDPDVGASTLIPQPLPRWVGSGAGPSGGARDAAFAAGAALLALDQIVRTDAPWLGVLRGRLTLKAASIFARLLRLKADAAALRDAQHLTRCGDDPGPAGRLHRLLRQLASRPTRHAGEIFRTLEAELRGAPVAAELVSLLEADLALAQKLGWATPLLLHAGIVLEPALRLEPEGRRPRADRSDWPAVCDHALLLAARACHAEAVTLARRAEALALVARRLRTRDQGRGLGLVLADDAIAPWRMVGRAGFGSDRAARRFCESLAAQGALRLLTDRPTFRLYGL